MWRWEQLLETLDAVPAWAKGLYKKNAEGKFELLPEVAETVDTSGLNSALDKERKAAKEAKQKLSAYEKFGKLEELQEKLDAANERGDDAGAKKWEKRIAELQKEKEEALRGKEEEIGGMRRSLDKYLIDSEATAALSSVKGNSTLLLPHLRGKVKVFQENGEYIARAVDSEGDPRGNGKGGFMTVKDLVEEFRKDKQFSVAFEASGKTGSGTQPGGNGGTPDTTKMTATDKISQGLAARKT